MLLVTLACGARGDELLPYPESSTPNPVWPELTDPHGIHPKIELLPIPLESPAENIPAEVPEEVAPLLLESEEVPVPWYNPKRWIKPLVQWESAIELGLNGSSGTSDSLSIRTGGYVKHASDVRKFKFDIYHNRTSAGGVETQNNAQMNFRHDWLSPETPWTVYGQSQVFYDQFQDFDLNLNLNAGLGYRILDEEWVDLMGRIGSGMSREFGGQDDHWVPEAQFAIEYEQQLSETQKLSAKVDYFPEWASFSRYRVVTELGWEVALLVPSNASLKVAATDRYDSDPNGVPPHNLNYSVLLLWKL